MTKYLKEVNCFVHDVKETSSPIFLFIHNDYEKWLDHQTSFIKNYLRGIDFSRKSNTAVVPNNDGNVDFVICIINDDMFSIANLSKDLPDGEYYIKESSVQNLELYYLGFALGCYKFDKYKSIKSNDVKLLLPKNYKHIVTQAEATYIARDMISTPAEDMSPKNISDIIKNMSNDFNGDFTEIVGDELATQGYMGIYSVGKGSHRAPRLVHLDWGNKNNPRVSIVGKGVVFDTGGLNIKPAAGMLLMHKDMGGAANAIALSYLIMKNNLPINLSLVIPTVENAIDAKAFRPSDIITMKNGTTVQVVNTDAEGRLILAEPLHEESKKNPDILLDFATLTGAARVSVGTEISAFFTNNDDISDSLYKHAEIQQDDVWRLPLASRYKKNIKNEFADLSNCGSTPFGGAITAALFLEHFLIDGFKNWVHFDIMAWNNVVSAGKPIGGEAMGIRAAYSMLEEKYKK